MLPMLVVAGAAGCDTPAPEAGSAAPLRRGQWIWNQEHVSRFEANHAVNPEVIPTVLVAELHRDGAQVVTRLRLKPTVVSPSGAVSVIIRLDDNLHPLWDQHVSAEMAGLLGAPLSRILEMVDDRLGRRPEVQLDYDCPNRHLPAWADVLVRLTEGPLDGQKPWITSIPTHLDTSGYGSWFSGKIAGHLLQVFDTGLPASEAGALGERALAAGLPWRVGLGGFEREGAPSHAAWFEQLDAVCRRPLCEGVWVFP